MNTSQPGTLTARISDLPTQGTQSLERMLAVLDAVAEEPTRSAALAQQLGIPRPTVVRMLGVLERHGYVVRAADDAYYLGTRPLELTDQWHRQAGVARLVAPALDELVERFQETAFAAVRDGASSLYVSGRESTRAVRLGLSLGTHTPLYAGAFSKTILAYAPDHILDAVLEDGLRPLAPGTITDPSRLRASLRQIRRQGFAETNAEHDEGVCGIAAPVMMPGGEAIAIGVALPMQRASVETKAAIRECVVEFAHSITQTLARSPGSIRLPGAGTVRPRRAAV